MKERVEAKPTPIFNALKTANMVRLRQVQLARWDDFRQIDWISELEYPELNLQQTQQLLSLK